MSERLLSDIVKEVMSRLAAEPEGARIPPTPPEASPSGVPNAPKIAMDGQRVITEADVLAAQEQGAKVLRVAERTIVTPLARDALREKGISLEVGMGREVALAEAKPPSSDLIALAADHGGYEIKEIIRKALAEQGRKVKDFGTFSAEPVDYPDFAVQVAEVVASGECYTGIIVDGSASASAMVANKVPGILAAACWDLFTARAAREHVNANVLTLGGKVIGPALALEMVKVWLDTSFAGGRHERRVEKIREIERKYLK